MMSAAVQIKGKRRSGERLLVCVVEVEALHAVLVVIGVKDAVAGVALGPDQQQDVLVRWVVVDLADELVRG